MTHKLIGALTVLGLLSGCSMREAGRELAWDTQPPERGVPISALAPSATVVPAPLVAGTPDPLQTGDGALVASLDNAIAAAGSPQTPPNSALAPQTPLPPITGQTGPASAASAAATSAIPIGGLNEGQISDDSFQSVSENATIEADRERIAALAERRVQLTAEPLPEREANVNLAAFARSTTHKIGEDIYPRSGLLRSRASAQCSRFSNPDAAQRAFLAGGGPRKDPMRMDPDGDGFVCGWSPMPFRNLRLPN